MTFIHQSTEKPAHHQLHQNINAVVLYDQKRKMLCISQSFEKLIKRDHAKSSIEEIKQVIKDYLTDADKQLIENINKKYIKCVYIDKNNDINHNYIIAMIKVVAELNSEVKMAIAINDTINEIDITNVSNHIIFFICSDQPNITLKFDKSFFKMEFVIEGKSMDFGKKTYSIFNANEDSETVRLNIDHNSNYYFNKNEEIFEFSGKPNLIDLLERYFRSKLTKEDWEKSSPKCQNLIYKKYIIQKNKTTENNKVIMEKETIAEINFSYLQPGIIDEKNRQIFKKGCNKFYSEGTSILFSAGYKYANQFIKYNKDNASKIHQIIDNLDKSPVELDKIIEKTGLLLSNEELYKIPEETGLVTSDDKWTLKQLIITIIVVTAVIAITIIVVTAVIALITKIFIARVDKEQIITN